MGSLEPPGFRYLKKGDGVVLIDPDNTRSVVEFTSVGQGAASGRISFFTYLGDRLGLSANR